MAEQSKNTTSYAEQSETSTSFTNQAELRGSSVTWSSVATTWATETRTWEQMGVISYSNQTKN